MILLSKSVHAQAGAQIAIHVTMSLSAYQPHWLKWTTRSMSHFPNDDECLYKAPPLGAPPGLPPPKWKPDPAAKAGCWVPWSGMSPGLRSPSLEGTGLEQMALAEERIVLKNESAEEADFSSGGDGQRDSGMRQLPAGFGFGFASSEELPDVKSSGAQPAQLPAEDTRGMGSQAWTVVGCILVEPAPSPSDQMRETMSNESAVDASANRRVLTPKARSLILQWLAPTNAAIKKIMNAERKSAREAIESSAGKLIEKSSAA